VPLLNDEEKDNAFASWFIEVSASVTRSSSSHLQDITSGMSQLSAEERAQLISHLKTKWSSVNTAYQKMTFTLDTPTKRKRKETYEQQLAEIEKDIQTLERGEVILVVED
jgi:predicted transcriptional regulator